MKAVSVREIGKELENLTPKEVRQLCLRLARFRKENKELLTYLLFESQDEDAYLEEVKADITASFDEIRYKGSWIVRKGVRKIYLSTRKYIRYSGNKKTEIDLLVHFCRKLREILPSHKGTRSLTNLYMRLTDLIISKISALHPDLYFDYGDDMMELFGRKN